jgi:hypothetical protein
VFCSEKETIAHLFYECVVAKQASCLIDQIFSFDVGSCYESMAKCWLCNKKFGIVNMFSSVVCWSIWKFRNSFCFQGVPWRSMKQVWCLELPMLRCCRILLPLQSMDGFEAALTKLKKRWWRRWRSECPCRTEVHDGGGCST